jgi:hypothetical protein
MFMLATVPAALLFLGEQRVGAAGAFAGSRALLGGALPCCCVGV